MIYQYYFDILSIDPTTLWWLYDVAAFVAVDKERLIASPRLLSSSHLILCEALPIYQDVLKARTQMWTQAVELAKQKMATMNAVMQLLWSNELVYCEEGQVWRSGRESGRKLTRQS